MQNFQVKKNNRYTPEIIEEVSRLHSSSFYRGWSPSETSSVLSSGNCALFTVDGKDIIKGFIIIRVVHDEAEIITIAVTSNSRRMGIAKLLIEAVINELNYSNINKIFLEVDVEHNGAIKLYEGFGFKKLATRKNYYKRQFGFSDAVIMEKII